MSLLYSVQLDGKEIKTTPMFIDIREVASKSAANITYLTRVLTEGAVRYIQLRRIATSP